MPLYIAILTFVSVSCGVGGGYRLLQNRHQVKERLHLYGEERATVDNTQREGKLLERFFARLTKVFSPLVTKRTSYKTLEQTKQLLITAGNPGGMQATDFITLKAVLAALAFVIGLMLPASFLVVLAVSIMMWLFPTIYLRQLAKKRQTAIALAVPDVLDLLTVSVEAGLGFDGAVSRVVEKMQGPLAEELQRMLYEIRIGKPRREALRNLSERTQVDYIRSFTAAIIQAEQLGVSIGKVLRIQSSEIRRQRRQKAEEEAMKAPVKMLIPLVTLVFPTLFVVLLGPAILSIMESF